jgi:hypothetical protein
MTRFLDRTIEAETRCKINLGAISVSQNSGSAKIKKFPRLRIESFGWGATVRDCEFDQARYLPFAAHDLIIAVEGEVVRSIEDIQELAERDIHKEKEFLEVKILPVIVGG